MQLATINPALLAQLPKEARSDFLFWRAQLEPLFALERGVTKFFDEIALRADCNPGTVRRKFYDVKKGGWPALVDRRKLGPEAWDRRDVRGLSAPDKDLIKTYCERYQRKNAAALKQLRRDWISGKVHTDTRIDPSTGFPEGWTPRNLARHVPTKFELKATRIGRSAAAAERSLVYTTRANLVPGQFYLFDDMWHDHHVNHLDQGKSGRPLEFHGLDLASACKFAWGMRVRTEIDGKNTGLLGSDFRLLLAKVFATDGYNPETGTICVVEHGTATAPEWMEQILFDATGGAITFQRSGMQGAAAHAGQYAGRSKGNFKIKAALESAGGLYHNEFAALPGQTGMNRDHSPDTTHGLLKRNDALLAALTQLPRERAEMLLWDLLTIQQFRLIADEIYARINARTDHDLEGWDMHYVPDPRTGLMRRLNPSEVMHRGRGALTRLSPAATAMILAKDCGVERTVRRSMVELRDSEISGDTLRFDARHLTEGDKVFSILNPYQPDALHCFDAKLRFVAALPRIHSIDRADTDAVMRQVAEASKIEAAALQPFRARHAADARRRAKDARHNAEVVNGPAPKSSRLPANADDFTAPDLDDAPRGSFEDSAGSLADEFADII